MRSTAITSYMFKKRRTCFCKNHFNSTNPPILLYTPLFCGYFKNCHQYHFFKTLQLYRLLRSHQPPLLIRPLLQLDTTEYLFQSLVSVPVSTAVFNLFFQNADWTHFCFQFFMRFEFFLDFITVELLIVINDEKSGSCVKFWSLFSILLFSFLHTFQCFYSLHFFYFKSNFSDSNFATF